MKKIFSNKLEVLLVTVTLIILAAIIYFSVIDDEVSVRYLNIIMNFYLAMSFIYIGKYYKKPANYFLTIIYILLGILWIFKPYV